jgi:cytoskeleton protein RodZ
MEVNQEVSGMIDELVRESLGSVLRVEREKMGLSCRDVAESLRLMPYQIEAIENEDFSGFKADVFVKAYIKNYAQFLKLESTLLIKDYELNHRLAVSDKTQAALRPVHATSRKRYLGIVTAITVLLLLWFLNSFKDEPTTESTVNSSALSSDAPSLVTAEFSGDGYDNPVEVTDSTNVLIKSTENDQVQSSVGEIEALIDKLDLSFTNDCWVEVKDKDGKVLLADLKHSEENITIKGDAPFTVLLGYAPGVKLQFNGEAVKIDIGSRSQSAKLVVGG